MMSAPTLTAAAPYDPLQLAWRQSADLQQRLADASPTSASAADALKLLVWIELGEETMLRAEDDCLVEYDQQHHALLHQLYESWLSIARRLLHAPPAALDPSVAECSALSDDDLGQLRSGAERVAQWLQTQADIERHTLPHAELSAMAHRANLSAGARGTAPPSDG